MHISGPIKTQWLEDGRNMVLIESVICKDDRGKCWVARKGMIFDGASVPRILWRIWGPPFVGKYREAAVFHDAYYIMKTRPRKQVDLLFYDLMVYFGVPKWKAYIGYLAVRAFGPRF